MYIFLLALAGVILLGGGYYLGTKKVSLQQKVSEQNPIMLPSPTANNNKPSPSVILQQSTMSKKLAYSLPSSWKVSQDSSGTLQIGYNPELLVFHPVNAGVNFTYVANPGSFGISIRPYDGGSRHQFIYNQLNETNPQADQTKDYHEKQYVYNGWSCLVFYGLTYSAGGTTWGMCAISSTQALFFGASGADEQSTEQAIQTIKLLK